MKKDYKTKYKSNLNTEINKSKFKTKKRLIVVYLILILAIFALVFAIFNFNQKTNTNSTQRNISSSSIQSIFEAQKLAVESSIGTYDNFSLDLVNRLPESQKIVYFFYQQSNDTSKLIDNDLTLNIPSISKGLSIMKVDFDATTSEISDLKTKYNISAPNEIVYASKDGVQIKKTTDLKNLIDIEKFVQPENASGSFNFATNSANSVNSPSSSSSQNSTLRTIAYQPYTEKLFQEAQPNKKILLFFTSDDCGACTKINDIIEVNQSLLPDTVLIFKVDKNIQSELAKKYEISESNKFILVDKAGNSVKKAETFADLEQILNYAIN